MRGAQVKTAHDGAAALEVAESFRPELLLLDIGMPKLNGYEAARRLRDRPWGRDALIVAMTGWGQPDDKRRAVDAGFDRHLTKPVDLNELESIVAAFRRAIA